MNTIMENIRKTALNEEHIKLGAKMVPFGGWNMPLQYGSIIDEHNTVRKNAGLFDVSHMGEVFLTGADAVEFLQSLVPQDISALKTGKAVYCQLLNNNGGMIDDLIIYRLEDVNDFPYFMLIVNASRINEDYEWIISKKSDYNVDIYNESDKLSMIALQGPFSSDIIEELGLIKSEQPERFSAKNAFIGSAEVIICRTGYTGEDGFEIVVSNSVVPTLWRNILEKGVEYSIKPIGLGARDTLRLEAAMLLYGQDMDEMTSPVEAGLSWSIAKNKQEIYSGKDDILMQLGGAGLKKRLIGFKMLDKSIPRHDYDIFIDDKPAGKVTSGGIAPYLGYNIGLGYIDAEYSPKIGDNIQIDIRGKLHPAQIVKRPFYTRGE